LFLLFLSPDKKTVQNTKNITSGKSNDKFGGTFLQGSIGDAGTLNPLGANDNASSEIIALLFNGLVKYNKDLEIESDLCTIKNGWEIKDNGKTIIFNLRKNIFWHDEIEFTSEDVLFTYTVSSDKSVQAAYSSEYQAIEKVTALDRYTVKVEYKKPHALNLALETWMLPILPEHILKNTDLKKCSFNRRPIGTGPFKFKEWIPDETITLVANESYFNGRPYLDRFIFRIIPQKSNMFLMLKNGEIDMMSLTPDQYIKQASNDEFNLRFQKFKYSGFSYTYLGFNLKQGLFKDPDIRLAICHAIDRQAMVTNILNKLGELSNGPFLNSSWACDPDIKPPEFDPDKARKLLGSKGWKDRDNNGYLDKPAPDGKTTRELEFTMITNNGNEERKLAAEIICSNLKSIGIRVNFKRLAWTALLEKINKRDFQALVLGWDLPIDPDQYNIWHSSTQDHGNNILGYENPEVDNLLTLGRNEIDQEKRALIYRKIHALILADSPAVFLYIPDNLYAIDRRFKNVSASRLGIKHNLTKWYVPKEDQRY
jgi:peptide/nickel transport system substrate-binding protein